MNFVDAFSSSGSDEENPHSSLSEGNRDNISTDVERSTKHKTKTKNIKKNYDAIEENGKVYHYEDDPQEYKRIRKKIQNRLSARRVRGRKENAFDNLEQEVEYLRKVNSELQLSNARLETENRSLKEQLDFMKGLVKTSQNSGSKTDPIEKYLSPQTLNHSESSMQENTDFESPFMEDESDWLRLPNRRQSSNSWAMLAVFTLVLAVFVIPSDTTTNTPTVLFQTGQTQQEAQVVKTFGQTIIQTGILAVELFKAGFKYFLIFGYAWFLYKYCERYMKRKKMKKV